jgi:hypothetical protein
MEKPFECRTVRRAIPGLFVAISSCWRRLDAFDLNWFEVERSSLAGRTVNRRKQECIVPTAGNFSFKSWPTRFYCGRLKTNTHCHHLDMHVWIVALSAVSSKHEEFPLGCVRGFCESKKTRTSMRISSQVTENLPSWFGTNWDGERFQSRTRQSMHPNRKSLPRLAVGIKRRFSIIIWTWSPPAEIDIYQIIVNCGRFFFTQIK